MQMRAVYWQAQTQQFAVAQYRLKNIVEIMGYPSGKSTDCLHFMRLAELCLQLLPFALTLFAFRDVTPDAMIEGMPPGHQRFVPLHTHP